jgi:signal transduction histidine kinase
MTEIEAILRAGITWHRCHKIRRELLKTFDHARLLSNVIDVLRDTLGLDLVHPFLFQPGGAPRRFTPEGGFVEDPRRRFLDRIAAGSLSVIAEDRKRVASLDPVSPGVGALMAVPIMGSGQNVRGALEVESPAEHGFSTSLVDVLRYLADLIGMSLEVGREVELITQVYRELRHSIATNVQIVAMQAQRLQKLTLRAVEPDESDDSLRERVKFIADNAAIIEGAVQDIKAVVAEPPKPQRGSLDIVELVQGCLQEQEPRLVNLGITHTVEAATGTFIIKTDRQLLSYSLRCVMNNAIEAIQDNRLQQPEQTSPQVDEIVVCVRDVGAAVRIEVRDSGIGFDKTVKDQLFQPLFSTKAKQLPTGRAEGSVGIDRLERLLDLMGQWCRQDPRSKTLPAGLGRGMEILIRDSETVDMYVGDSTLSRLDLADLERSALCHVGTDAPLADEWQGRGEGLYSVQKYIRRLGGTVDASSEGVRKGATITITLPTGR